ncbi:flippase [Pseudomonadota bacterium]
MLSVSRQFRRYFANTVWLFSERTLRMAANLLVMIYVARYLGPDKYGLLSYSIALVSLFASISGMGIDRVLVRELVNNPDKRDDLLGSAFVLKLFGSIAMIGIVSIVAGAIEDDSFTIIFILIVAFSYFFQAFNVIGLNFESEVLAKHVARISLIQTVFALASRLLLIWVEASLIWFALVLVAETLVQMIAGVIIYEVIIGHLMRWKANTATALRMLKDSWPLILSGLSIAIYMKLDQVMIKFMMGTESVGVYSVAVKLAEGWNILPVVICTSLFPTLVNASKRNKEQLNNRLQDLYDLMIWIVLPIAIIVSGFSDELVELLFGNNFIDAAPVLTIYIWSSFAVYLGVASSQYLAVENLLRYSMYRTLLGAVTNLLLNLILIPAFGLVGAAIATLISYVCAVFMLQLFRKPRYQVTLMIRSLLLISSYEKLAKHFR